MFYSLGEEHATGMHSACMPVCLVPLVHTGFALGCYLILHTHLLKIRL